MRLVRREGIHSTLTEAGARLLPRAHDILQQKEALEQEARAERGMASGTLRIASFGATPSLRLLPLMITEYRQRQPAVHVMVDEHNDDTVVQWLLEQRVEVGFVVLPDDRFNTVPLVQDELVAPPPARHPLAQRSAIRGQDLQGEPFIRTTAGSGAQIDRFLADAGAQPQSVYHFEQMSSMLGFVAQGHAIAIAARLALPEAPPDGIVYRPLSPKCAPVTALAVRSLRRLYPAAAAFVELTQEMAERKRFGR